MLCFEQVSTGRIRPLNTYQHLHESLFLKYFQ